MNYRQATHSCNPGSGFLFELPGGDEHPPGDASGFDPILVFWGSELILLEEKDNTNHLEMIRSQNSM